MSVEVRRRPNTPDSRDLALATRVACRPLASFPLVERVWSAPCTPRPDPPHRAAPLPPPPAPPPYRAAPLPLLLPPPAPPRRIVRRWMAERACRRRCRGGCREAGGRWGQRARRGRHLHHGQELVVVDQPVLRRDNAGQEADRAARISAAARRDSSQPPHQGPPPTCSCAAQTHRGHVWGGWAGGGGGEHLVDVVLVD